MSSQILSFVEDTQGQKWKRQKYKEPETVDKKSSSAEPTKDTTPANTTTALSYDEVTDDLDEIVALRGEGRYFGVTDPDDESGLSRQTLGPLCANCHKRGHIRAKCKVVICHKCGAVDDHYESQCPTTIICGRCGEKGHIVLACKSKVQKRQYCRLCDSFRHGNYNCPSTWRSYIVKPSAADEEESYVLPRIYCYNCGSDEHYGDECGNQRSSRIPNFGSAFSGNNLPKKYREMYFLRISGKGEGSNGRVQSNQSNQNSQRKDWGRSSNPYMSSGVEVNSGTSYFDQANSAFGSKNFINPNRSQPVKSGFLPKRAGDFPRGPKFDSNGSGKGSFLKQLNEKTKAKKKNSNAIYNQPTRSGTIAKNGSKYSGRNGGGNSNSYGNGNGNANGNGNSYGGSSKPTRSGFIANRKSQNAKRMKY